jgi:hypothetical protein
MITLAIIPGPSKPDNIMSFLRPIVDEIRSLGNNGFRVVKDSSLIYKGKVHLMGLMGDIPGVAELMNHAGHMAYHGCRICDVRGVSDGARYFLHSGNIRSKESLVHGDPVSLFFLKKKSYGCLQYITEPSNGASTRATHFSSDFLWCRIFWT